MRHTTSRKTGGSVEPEGIVAAAADALLEDGDDPWALSAQMLGGDMFAGSRVNLLKSFDRVRTVSAGHALGEYQRNPFAYAVVEQLVEATWAAPPEIGDGEGSVDGALESFVNEHLDDVEFWRAVETVDRRSLIAGDAAGILVIGDDEDDLAQPVGNLSGMGGIEAIRGVTPAWKESLTPGGLDADGRVEVWNYATSSGRNIRIHADRVFWFSEARSANGTGPIKRCYDVLFDIRKLLGSTAELWWRKAAAKVFLKLYPDQSADEMNNDRVGNAPGSTAAARLVGMVKASNRGITPVISAQMVEDAKLLEPASGNSDPDFMTHVKALSAGSGVPLRRLLGNEEGKLAGDQDEDIWADRIASRRRRVVEPAIRDLLKRFAEWGILPSGRRFAVVWESVKEERTKEQADKAKVYMDTNVAAATAGLEPPYSTNQILEAAGLPPVPGGDAMQEPPPPEPTGDPASDM